MVFSAELHCHSIYSDGHMTPEEILCVAKKKKIDIVAVTDHNEVKGALETEKVRKPGDPLVVPGAEISTPYGHLLAYFIRKNIVSKNFEDVIKEIRDQGGIAIMAHPVHIPLLYKLRRKNIGFPPDNILRLVDGIEVFNGENVMAANVEAAAIAKKMNIKVRTAGSDAHFTSEIGSARTFFDLDELSEKEIGSAFRSGNIRYDENLKTNRIYYYITAVDNILKGKRYGKL